MTNRTESVTMRDSLRTARDAAAEAVRELATRAEVVAGHEMQAFKYEPTLTLREQAASAHAVARDERQDAAEALRRAMCEYAVALRETGVPPERMLVEIKTVVRQSVPPGTHASYVESMVARVTSWCIASYYDVSHRKACAQ